MLSSPFPCPLESQGSIWKAEEKLQTGRTCFVIFPMDETEIHQPVGFMDCSCGRFLSMVATHAFLSSFLWICVPGYCVQLQEWLPCPKHTGQIPTPSVTQVHFMHCRAEQQFSCRVGGSKVCSKASCQGQWQERGEMLRKRVLRYCTGMGV